MTYAKLFYKVYSRSLLPLPEVFLVQAAQEIDKANRYDIAMDQEIKTLLQATAQGRLHETLKSRKLTPELASAARQAFLEARDGGTAIAAAFVAGKIYEALGDRKSQILNLIDCLQIELMSASKVQQYQTVRVSRR